jgi:hypothetical protein
MENAVPSIFPSAKVGFGRTSSDKSWRPSRELSGLSRGLLAEVTFRGCYARRRAEIRELQGAVSDPGLGLRCVLCFFDIKIYPEVRVRQRKSSLTLGKFRKSESRCLGNLCCRRRTRPFDVIAILADNSVAMLERGNLLKLLYR